MQQEADCHANLMLHGYISTEPTAIFLKQHAEFPQLYIILLHSLLWNSGKPTQVSKWIIPDHTAAVNTMFFRDTQIKISPSPARSLDTSPIEHVLNLIDEIGSPSQLNEGLNFKLFGRPFLKKTLILLSKYVPEILGIYWMFHFNTKGAR